MRSGRESTTALSSTSRIDDRGHDPVGVGERLERGVRPAAQKLIDSIRSGRHTDGPHAERAPTLDVGRRVAYDDELLPLHVHAKLIFRSALRDCRKLGAMLVIAAERADPKEIGL